ncbi:MAG: hypothetical protein SVR08_13830 [Spirochaetota bacterium]|nr:hypothetical protein [Spirochaetota bacterium]
MKKKVYISFFITIAILFSSIQFLVGKTKEKFFRGRVIYISEEYIEIKRSETEIKLYFTDETLFVEKDATKGTKEIIELCQVVKVYYTKDKKNILKKLIIVKESDCFRE